MIMLKKKMNSKLFKIINGIYLIIGHIGRNSMEYNMRLITNIKILQVNRLFYI